MAEPGLDICRAGYSIITDLGRRAGAVGLSVNGALDQFAARAANILVGNNDSEGLIESVGAGLTVVGSVDLLVAVTGARCVVEVAGVVVPTWEPVCVSAGQPITVRDLADGLRCYLAVSGGFEVPELMGSVAPDGYVGFSGPLSDGDRVSLRRATPALVNPVLPASLLRMPPLARSTAGLPIMITTGPDADEFADLDVLTESEYVVGARSNHTGLRLEGPTPTRRGTAETLSRGVPIGAIEVPSGDGLLVLHRGRNITAGYPVAAVVTSIGLDVLAQRRPGDSVRFRLVTVNRALAELRRQEARLALVRERFANAVSALGREDVLSGAGQDHGRRSRPAEAVSRDRARRSEPR